MLTAHVSKQHPIKHFNQTMNQVFELFQSTEYQKYVEYMKSIDKPLNVSLWISLTMGDMEHVKISEWSTRDQFVVIIMVKRDKIDREFLLQLSSMSHLSMVAITFITNHDEENISLIRKIFEYIPSNVNKVHIHSDQTLESIGFDFLKEVIMYSAIQTMSTHYYDPRNTRNRIGYMDIPTEVKDVLDIPLDERGIRTRTKSAMKR